MLEHLLPMANMVSSCSGEHSGVIHIQAAVLGEHNDVIQIHAAKWVISHKAPEGLKEENYVVLPLLQGYLLCS